MDRVPIGKQGKLELLMPIPTGSCHLLQNFLDIFLLLPLSHSSLACKKLRFDDELKLCTQSVYYLIVEVFGNIDYDGLG